MNVRPIQKLDLYYEHFISHWHREVFGVDATAIDIDLCGYCPRCTEPLYLIEATRSREKSTRVLDALARRAHVPSIVVLHNDDVIIRATWRTPAVRVIGGEEELKDALTELRLNHTCEGV